MRHHPMRTPAACALSALLLTKNFAGPPCAFLCTRARFESCGGFDTELQGTEDWDLWASLVFAGCEVVPVFRIGAYYRVHSTSWTRNQLRMGLQYALYHRRVLARIRENPERVAELGKLAADLSRDVRGQLADALWGIAYFCRNEGRYWSAFYFYLASLRWGRLTAIVGIGKLIPHRLLRTSTDGRPSPLATLKKAGTTP